MWVSGGGQGNRVGNCCRVWSGVKVINLFTDVIEQHTFKNANNCLNSNIYSYLKTSGGQSSNPYLNVVHFFNTRVTYKSVAA